MTRYIFIFLFTLTALLFSQNSFLEPDEAFKPSISQKDASSIDVTVTLGKSIYLYINKFKAEIKNSDTVIIDSIVKPEGEDYYGDAILKTSPTINITLAKNRDINSIEEIDLVLEFEGCSDRGLCYQPIEKLYKIKVDTAKLPLKISDTLKSPIKELSQTEKIANTFIDGDISLILITFFTFGLMLALTPCVFPMIPILSSILVSQHGHMSAKRGFMLSLVYVLAVSVAYAIAGVFAGLFGSNIQIAMQNPWVISTFALLFVGLAISMFGFFKIGLPASWQNRITKKSKEAGKKGGYLGVAIMGLLSALIVGPCIAPPLAGALIYIGQTGDALLGGAALFVLSIGMGVPLLLIGIGAGKFMPDPGVWMQNVSRVFGVTMLGIAIWMLDRVIPDIVTMFLWAILAIISSVYMGALEPLERGNRSWNALFKGIGVIIFIYGVMLFYGAVTGATNPLEPIQKTKMQTQEATPYTILKFTKIHSLNELETLLKQNRGKKVMLDFYADWCTSCKELENITFKDPVVINALKDYLLIKADVTKNTEDEQALSKQFGVFGPPAMIFFDEDGKKLEGFDLIGYIDAKEFMEHIERLDF